MAQNAVGYGDWQLHLPIDRAKALADAGDRVYVVTENSFFYYDKALNTTTLLSRREGLSDVGVRTVAYDSVTRQVLVVYKNNNLDVLRPDGTVQNVGDIVRKQIPGNRDIYHVYFNNKLAYISAGFGIVVLDMVKLETRASYGNIGPNGQTIRVSATTVLKDSLYAATAKGLMRGRLSDNLLDYRRWTTDLPTRTTDAEDRFSTLATYNGHVYAGLNNDNLQVFRSGAWRPEPRVYTTAVRQLTPTRAGLLVTDESRLLLFNAQASAAAREIRHALIRVPFAAQRGKDGSFYVADLLNGLVKVSSDGQQAENFLTNAPASVTSFSVLANAQTNTVDVFSGGYADRYLQKDNYGGFYEFKEGRWTNINSQTIPDRNQFPNPKDLSRGVRTPDGTLYVASYGNGLLEWKGPGSFRWFTPTNSPLISSISDLNYTRLTDLATDADGNVWVVNRHQSSNTSGLFVFHPTASTWERLPYFPGSENLERIALDDYGVAWVTAARAGGQVLGVIAFDPANRTTHSFSTADGLPATDAYDIVKDRLGDIWVATTKGVAVFNDPSLAFTQGSAFRTPTVKRGEGANYPALFTEVVKTIAVDGANRKWFGTDNGLWLFNAEGDEAIQHFTTSNSPLPSNSVVDVDINDRTGEVFVVTADAGVVSYRGSATVTEGSPDCAKVFPNPVRSNFGGQVGISGLANNADVKITDVAGKLVYQTRAAGGTVTWNLNDYNGRRVESGVYLVLSATADGKQGCISKLAVIK
ncbi:T9SS type A sorting domain-containing protein [Hymenobacter sp. BT491]|uniref:type IX secretion system anionic LPS delivery protein PorZ n=1 Tax=Hymenobacter sp. BT491 TaxID=2766779 RepID=UPI001653B052|nr:T9SS type A sorting domain-containing protein [Hymenobacter sp. BT491]MBC6992459.1 T9SS type A sorting domain-containing protein [Hymenobacter sp. BT491]